MNQQNLILCDNHPTLLTSLKLCEVNIENPDIVEFINFSNDVFKIHENSGMVILLHAPPITYAFEKLIKCRKQNPNLPVVVVTSVNSFEEVRSLFKLGAADVLPFPAPPDQLQNCLRLMANSTEMNIQENTAVSGTETHTIEAELLGRCTIKMNGTPLDLPNKTKQVLGLFIAHYPNPIRWDDLAMAFWPDKYRNNIKSAKISLNVEITKIRNILRKISGIDADFITRNENHYQLDTTLTIKSDMQQFVDLFNEITTVWDETGKMSEKQVDAFFDLYKGRFMDSCDNDGNHLLQKEREKYNNLYKTLNKLCPPSFELYKNEVLANKTRLKKVATKFW